MIRMKKKKKKRKNTRKRRIIVLRIKIIAFFIAVISGIVAFWQRDALSSIWNRLRSGEPLFHVEVEVSPTPAPLPKEPEPEKEPVSEDVVPDLEEENIYTFMQGPVAWNTKADWSGEWCEFNMEGGNFSVFGCGLCALASIYGTMTPYECSPVDMYYYAQLVTDYAPSEGYGAIDWPFLKQTLESAGIANEVFDKDDSFEDFCQAMESAVGAIVLVSSANDASYWKDTEGHYVTIWSYDAETGNVLLSDSGDPEHNRQWIPLSYVYSALKTSGEHQYLLIYSYNEEKNSWKYSGINEEWNAPDYYHEK
ncbi:MAG: hypothetical protein HUJ72_11900 [Blautia sp.]|nr:hypothetical protein [Blautia sp.]